MLNDIFRYIAWEEDEYDGDAEGAQSTDPKPDTTTLTNSDDPAQQKADTDEVDRKLAEAVEEKKSDVKVNGHIEPEDPVAEDAEEPKEAPAAVKEEATLSPEPAVETPRDPDPTPVASSPQPARATAPPQAPEPAKPAAPKTWASLVGRAAAPVPTNGSSGTSAPKTAQPAQPAQPKPKIAPMSGKSANDGSAQTNGNGNGNSEWQMADSRQRQNRPHSQSVTSNQANVLGYVKNVTDKVDASILKAKLQAFGELAYFDVSRPKVSPLKILVSIRSSTNFIELRIHRVC